MQIRQILEEKEGEKMGKNGKFDYKEFEKFKDKITQLEDKQNEFMEACAKELAARLLAKAIKRTPVRKKEDCPPGVVGGTLRRGWTAGKDVDKTINAAKQFTNELKVNKVGDAYKIEITNPVEYASYVEFGHRARNHKDWVEGKFMMTISEQEIQTIAPKVLENKLKKLLGECFT